MFWSYGANGALVSRKLKAHDTSSPILHFANVYSTTVGGGHLLWCICAYCELLSCVRHPAKGLEFLQTRRFVGTSAPQVAQFLVSRKGLARSAISEYFSQMREPFVQDVVKYARHVPHA